MDYMRNFVNQTTMPLIAAFMLASLAACAPIEVAPLEETRKLDIPAPTEKEDKLAEKATEEAKSTDEATEEATEEAAEEVIVEQDAQSVVDTSVMAPQEDSEKPKPIDVVKPFDPTSLVSGHLSNLTSLFGPADLLFTQGASIVSQYRQDTCIMLVFAQNDSAQIITHIDLRSPILGQTLDKDACHYELGAKTAHLTGIN